MSARTRVEFLAAAVPSIRPRGLDWYRVDLRRMGSARRYREALVNTLLDTMAERGHLGGLTEDGAVVVTLELPPDLLEELLLFDADDSDLEAEPDRESQDEA